MQNVDSHSSEPERRSQCRGRLLLLAAVLLWSTSGLFAKSAVFDDWPLATRGLLFSFWRVGFAGLLLIPFVRRPRWTWRFVPMTVSFAVMNFTFLSAVVLTTAANAIWLQATAPLWVFLFTVVALRHRVSGRDWMLLLCCLGGVAVILTNSLVDADRTGIVMGLLSGLSFGSVMLCLRWLRDENAIWITVNNMLVSAALVLPILWWQGMWQTPTCLQLVVLAAFGIVQMGLPYILVTKAVRAVSGWEASAVAILEPVLMPLWVFLFIHEIPSTATIIGASLIFVGLVARICPRRN